MGINIMGDAYRHAIWLAIFVLFLIAERLLELKSANRNFHRLIESGGQEFGASHYAAIIAMHTAFFFSLIIEFVLRGYPLTPFWPAALAIFLIAQALRIWTRLAMGERWTTRIVVIPGEQLITNGPFRFVSHPIYVAVALELFSAPLLFGLYTTCILFSILNGIVLLFFRIPSERAALEWSQTGMTATKLTP
ncbi:MAG: isoprenylcysteine carboxyl methyltransferase family protein [Candidatus Kapaibacterium sp.]